MIDVSILIAAGGLILAAATFFVGRLTAATGKGKQDGVLLARLDSIDEKLTGFGASLHSMEGQIGAQRDRITCLETKMEIYHRGGEIRD